LIEDPSLLDSIDPEHAALVASRHGATAEVARRLQSMVPAGGRVLVAMSGGRDSTALSLILLALHRRRHPSMLEPVIGHVDHALRDSSGTEAVFVERVAERLGMSCLQRRLDWRGHTGRVTSETARDARWAALEAMAAEAAATSIVTAHHADDQAETVLMRLARGTGLAGLNGIPMSRTTPSGIRVIRPLLGRTRAELTMLVEAAGVPWIDDPTNEDRSRPRERLRHEVLPALESIHPGAARHLASLAEECAAGGGDDVDLDATSIDRTTCRELTDAALATRLRTLAESSSGRSVRSVPREVWRRAASMVADREPRPRRLRIDAGLELVVHRDSATFEVADPDTAEAAFASPDQP
jgi:tRNA(Ile)-lysidine synthetase-like protein